ncbi:MAG: hypothetical protein ACKO2G_08280, partial [Verrucomicrobiales bacterium]
MTSILKSLKRSVLQSLARRDERRILNGKDTVKLGEFRASLVQPDSYYAAAHRFFHGQLCPELRAHRAYFRQENRGFGEDAFHTMWWLLLQRLRPA